jgi:hypothetical protein
MTDTEAKSARQTEAEALGRSAAGRTSPHPVYWLIAGALLTIALNQLMDRASPSLSGAAFAQPTTSAGARGVFAFSGQLTKSTYGVYVVDTDTATMWMYEYNGTKGCLRLAASRSWRFDRYLENHNLCDLPPETVEQMVEEQRLNRKQSDESKMP